MLDPGLVIRLVVAALLAGCHLAETDAATDDGAGDDDAAEPPQGAEGCVTADDCALVATTCCDCPTYAVAGGDYDDGCEELECDPDPASCPAIVAACDAGVCTARCMPVTCDLTCAEGFAADAAGCLICACGGGEDRADECASDDDCTRVPADCCGCARGGADTAVPAGTEGAFGDSLMCPADPQCPDVDVCDPDLAARCLAGTCTVGETTPCGRPDLPPCPEGAVCVLNADSDATTAAVGSCVIMPP